MRSYLILSMCLLFLIQYFFPFDWLKNTVIGIALVAFAASAMHARAVPRWFGISMMAIGIVLEFNKGEGFAGIRQGIFMNLPLIALVVLVPLLSLPLKLGRIF
ncbi:hypothetical protein [Paenibacillus cremeus]|uniref:hypothetical protein n=1 Tax=Paenibacillus cremeus TaxID=2163881 RepID=UPI00119FAF3E|nr:hypothetical protein [Paenibacillus cremeus]